MRYLAAIPAQLTLLVFSMGVSGQTVLFRDDFSTFALGTTWQAPGGYSPPDLYLGATTDGSRQVLRMMTSTAHASVGCAVGLMNSIPMDTSNLSSLTVETCFTSISGYAEPIELQVISAPLIVRWFDGHPFNQISWGAYRSSTDHPISRDVSYHLNEGTYYRLAMTFDNSGTYLTLRDASGASILASDSSPLVTIRDFRQPLDLSILQVASQATAEANVDWIEARATFVPEPSAFMMLVVLACFGSLRARRRR